MQSFSPIVDAFLRSSQTAAAVLTIDGIVRMSNDAWKEDSLREGDLPALKGVLVETIETESPRHLEIERERRYELLPVGDGAHVIARVEPGADAGRPLRVHSELILQAAGEGIYGLDVDGRTTFVNAAATEMIGWHREELIGQSQHAILHHSREDGSHFPLEECPIYATLRDGEPRKVSHDVFWRKDGSAFPVEYTTTPVVERGRLAGAVVVFRDLTEIRKALQRTSASEARLRAMMDALPDTIARISRSGVIRDIVVPEGFNTDVLREQSEVPIDVRDVLGTDLANTVLDNLERAFETGQRQQFEYEWEVDGELRTREVRLSVAGDDDAVCIVRDITSERRAISRLHQSEQRFRAIFDSMFQFIGLMVPDGTLIEANQTALDFTGVQAEQVIGKKFWDTRWWSSSKERQSTLKAAVERAAKGEFVRYEDDVLDSEGRLRTIDFSIKPVFDDTGDVVLLIPEGRDIHDLKTAERRLRDSEERLSGIIDSALDAVMAFVSVRDDRGEIIDFEWIYANQRSEAWVHRTVESMIGQRLLVELPGNQEEGLFDDYVRVVETGEPSRREFYYEHDGIEAYFVNTAVKLGDGFMVTFRDVTEERQREEALRSSERLLARAQKMAGLGSWQWDPQTGELEWSDELYRIYGLEPDEPVSFEQYLEAVVPEDRGRIAASVEKVLEDRQAFAFEERIRRSDGDIRLLSSAGEVLEDDDGYLTVVGVCHDVTEARAAEDRLRVSERRLQYAQRIAKLGSWEWAIETGDVSLSDEMARILGLEDEAISYDQFIETVHEEDRARFERELAQAIAEESEFKFYCTIVRDKEERIVRTEGEVLRNASGRVVRLFATGHDVTEIRRAEDHIRESEQRFRQLAEQISDLVGVHDPDGRYAYVSPSSRRILGYEPHEMIGRRPVDFVHRDDVVRISHLTRGDNAPQENDPSDSVVRMKHKNGQWVWLELVTTAIRNESGTITSYQTSARDVTARVEAQQMAARSAAVLAQRNRELQDFAYVASHDLQEPLRKIRAFSELVLDDLGEEIGDDGRFYLTRIQESATRMATLISDLLAFSRISTRGKPYVTVDLASIVAQVVSDLEYQLRDVEGTVEYESLPTFEADESQIRQLMQNLIGNALKFHRPDLPPVVRIEGRWLDDPAFPGANDGPVIEIVVSDNGIGFDERYLDRIFTPFQRLHNRTEYAGTGMGLAICRRIVERHGGSITANSTPGSGSSFVVRLPVQRTNT